jgi:N-acetylglucosamine kinase-like BadF-type ATPase
MAKTLVADSGSTKTDWRVLDNGSVVLACETKGFNPMFTDHDYIVAELHAHPLLSKLSGTVDRIHYFGAGCSSDERKAIVSGALGAVFGPCQISVDHDMMGCAIALCQGQPGIANIIGTGSNSCFFDGKSTLVSHHGLGHVLGDEASGSYFGKKLIAYYLYELMPLHLREAFYKTYGITKEIALQRVYREPLANVYLASHAGFLSMHRGDPFIEQLIWKGMAEFVDTNVKSYPEHIRIPIHFTGSIAHHFEDVLRSVLVDRALQCGTIIQKPIIGLCEFYLKS